MIKMWRQIETYIAKNIAAEQERLFAWVPFLFALGIALYFALPIEPNIWLILAAFEFWLLLFYLLRHKNLHLLFVGITIVFCGFLNIEARTLYQAKHIENIETKTISYIKGRIKDISYSYSGKMRLLLEDAANFDKPLKGDYRLTLLPALKNVNIGQCVEMIATIFPREPLPVLNGYQLDRKYFYENLSAIGYTDSETFIIDCPVGSENHIFRNYISSVRRQVLSQIEKTLPSSQSGIAAALLIGEKTLIKPQIAENYRNSGLAHFLSVSGLHLGTIACLAFFVLRFLLALFPIVALKIDIKKVSAVAAIILSALYLLISGMAIPAQRAFIMTAVVFIGIIFNRQAISIRMVSFAALAVLIISPQALISMSFQMSFAAVYALVAFYESCKLNAGRQRGFFKIILLYLVGIIVCDFVASLATAPFSLYHFHRLAVYTSLGNLLAGPLIGLYIMPLILLCLISLPFGFAHYPLLALGQGIELLNKITSFVAHLPHSVWQSTALTFWALILIVCGGFWLCVWKNRWRYWGMVPIFLGLSSLFVTDKVPDVVFTPSATDIAVRDNNGNLQMLPRQNDAWIKQIWSENLGLSKVPADLQNNLHCSDEACVYNNRVTFFADDKIKIDGKLVDTSAGGYIFLAESPHWQPLWNSHKCRPWHHCAAR